MTKRIFRLVYDQARAGACQAIKTAPDGYIVKVTEPTPWRKNTVCKHSIYIKIDEPAKCVNTMRALTKQPIREVIMATTNHICVHCKDHYFNRDSKSTYCSLRCFHAARTKAAALPSSIRTRHDEHVDITPGCWIWTGLRTTKGYGRLGCSGVMRLAHRLSYELYVGEITDGLGVLHRCDNPPCVNPQHLFLGTAKANADDKVQKGRALRGESHPNSKFTEHQIRAMVSDKRPYKEIVADYGISKPHLCGLKGGQFWRHLGMGFAK